MSSSVQSILDSPSAQWHLPPNPPPSVPLALAPRRARRSGSGAGFGPNKRWRSISQLWRRLSQNMHTSRQTNSFNNHISPKKCPFLHPCFHVFILLMAASNVTYQKHCFLVAAFRLGTLRTVLTRFLDRSQGRFLMNLKICYAKNESNR